MAECVSDADCHEHTAGEVPHLISSRAVRKPTGGRWPSCVGRNGQSCNLSGLPNAALCQVTRSSSEPRPEFRRALESSRIVRPLVPAWKPWAESRRSLPTHRCQQKLRKSSCTVSVLKPRLCRIRFHLGCQPSDWKDFFNGPFPTRPSPLTPEECRRRNNRSR